MKKVLVMLLAIASIGVASAQTTNTDDVSVKISKGKFEKTINVPQSCIIAAARLIEDTLSEQDVATIHRCLGEVITNSEKTFYYDNISLYFNEPKNKKYIAMTELQVKADKLLKTIDGYGNLRMVDVKSVPKLRKILTKSKFAPLTVELKEIKLKDILDV